MPPFPDSLPPYGVATVYKFLIYFGILYVITTAITTWFITRRRSFPKRPKKSARQEQRDVSTQPEQTTMGITESLSFDDTMDRLSSLKVEVQSAEAALDKLRELQENGQLSQSAYDKLSSQYKERVSELSNKMNDMLQTSITSDTGEVSEGISDSEIDQLEADLEQQLMDLDKDDAFLKPRAKRSMDEIFDEDTASQPTASQPSQPSPQPQPQPQPEQPVATQSQPSSPPPTAKPASQPTSSPSQPKATPQPSQPKATQSSTPQAQPAVEKKKVPMPPPPNKPGSQSASGQKKSVSAPPSPKKRAAAPPPPPKKQEEPSQAEASQPKASQPLSAAQPMKVEADDDEGMFAKSTSIAALRMDMLRELARLKKLIPEDQEENQ